MTENVKKKRKNLFTTEKEPLTSPATAHVKTCTTLAHIRPSASGLPGCEKAALNQKYNRQHGKIRISQPIHDIHENSSSVSRYFSVDSRDTISK